MTALRSRRRAGFRACPRPALGVALAFLALQAAAAPRSRVEPGFGVTPGALVWTVEPAARRLVLRDLQGAERAVFPVGDEGHVLGVADSGARVTAPTPDGFRRQPARAGQERRVEARYVFRFADGSVRATVSTFAARGSEPAFLGDEVHLLRRERGAWSVVRVAPDGETPVGAIPEEAVRRRVGRPSGPRLSAGAGGIAVLFPGTRGEAAARLDHPEALFVPDPLAACGEGRTRFVLPHPSGLLRVSVRTAPSTDGEDRGDPLAVAELFDDSGRLSRLIGGSGVSAGIVARSDRNKGGREGERSEAASRIGSSRANSIAVDSDFDSGRLWRLASRSRLSARRAASSGNDW